MATKKPSKPKAKPQKAKKTTANPRNPYIQNDTFWRGIFHFFGNKKRTGKYGSSKFGKKYTVNATTHLSRDNEIITATVYNANGKLVSTHSGTDLVDAVKPALTKAGLKVKPYNPFYTERKRRKKNGKSN